jgi:hypothetical protein
MEYLLDFAGLAFHYSCYLIFKLENRGDSMRKLFWLIFFTFLIQPLFADATEDLFTAVKSQKEDVNAKNSMGGQSMLKLAQEKGFQEIVKILKKAGAKDD